MRERMILERFRRRNGSPPEAEAIDARVVLPLLELLQRDVPSTDDIMERVPARRLRAEAGRERMIPAYINEALRAHLDIALERLAESEGGLRHAGGSVFEFDAGGAAVPMVFHVRRDGAASAMQECDASGARFCCIVKAVEQDRSQPLVHPDRLDGGSEMRMIMLPDPGRFVAAAQALIERDKKEAPVQEPGSMEAVDERVLRPLMGFLDSADPAMPGIVERIAAMMEAELEQRDRMDMSNYSGFAMEAYVKLRIAEFAERRPDFSVTGIFGGAFSRGIIYEGDGYGGVTFIDMNVKGGKRIAEIDVLGSFSDGDLVRPLIFEIKSKPFHKLYQKKKERVFRKARRREGLVRELFSVTPYTCVICPGGELAMRRAYGMRILNIPGLEPVKDIASMLYAGEARDLEAGGDDYY